MCVDPLKSFRILLLELVDFTVLKKWGERGTTNKPSSGEKQNINKRALLSTTKSRRQRREEKYACTNMYAPWKTIFFGSVSMDAFGPIEMDLHFDHCSLAAADDHSSSCTTIFCCSKQHEQ
jgi:hypothetical protein